MSQIRGKNTKPEILFRKLAWCAGLRGYRIHAKIPGRPDLYFPRKKVAVFIDGCFWHGCEKCNLRPKSNAVFWDNKFRANKVRDAAVAVTLKALKIQMIRFPEHVMKKNPERCVEKLFKTLEKAKKC